MTVLSGKVAFGCVAEATPHFYNQVLRLDKGVLLDRPRQPELPRASERLRSSERPRASGRSSQGKPEKKR